ncbi:diphthine methyltransferase isoform X2 [Zerene cesonia]|uniref:diphthine methyltransferase isoform X2 n=2 Tax=Zerene cesonia TaxID=33412 RepID=UPI0018E56073|nr:diphthine methyltransferase isoform X2 [Zerene cesonia]
MEAMDIQAVESKLSDVTVTAIPMNGKSTHKELGHTGNSHATISTVPSSSPSSVGKDKDNSMSNQMVSWSTKHRWHTGYSADSVEWCPVEPFTDVLVCGTYQLDKSDEDQNVVKQKRLGRSYLFKINKNTPELCPVQSIDTSGILDQKWCYHRINDCPVLGIVTSEGCLQLYKLEDNDGTLNLNLWLETSIGENILALSLDWSTNKMTGVKPCVVVSDSGGNVTVWRVDGSLVKIGGWKAHDFEAWIGAFNYWNENVLYSGGDDCVFKCYDLRSPDAVMMNRCHEAGVTSVRYNIDVEHQLLTGSYDEKVRLWDARQLKRCINETDVCGGVWRLKWHPYNNNYILAACMYGGFRLLRLEEKINILYEYLEHESIAYGADWQFDNSLSMVATCSFYDCNMHIGEIVFDE